VNLHQLKKNIGQRVQLEPIACSLDENGRERREADDWIIQDVSNDTIRISNVRAGHVTLLGKDHIHHFISNPDRSREGPKYGFLVLNVQIFLQGDRLWLRPTSRPGEAVSPQPATDKTRPDPSYTLIHRNPSPKPKENYPSYLGVSSLTAEEPRSFLPDASPTTILKALRQLPALSRRRVAEDTYRGRWAQWQGVIDSIREGDECYVVIVTTDDRELVSLTFPRSWHTEIEDLNETDRISFEGQVLTVTDLGVELVRPIIREHLRELSA
jgi:hypothetical protein